MPDKNRMNLTQNRAAWGLLTLAALAAYLFENNGGTLAVLAVCAGLPLLSALWLYLPRRSAALSWAAPDAAIRGERVDASLQSVLRGLPGLQPTLRLAWENAFTGEGEARRVRLRRGEGSVPLAIPAVHCGLLRLRADECLLTDPLGLFTRRLSAAAQAECEILPRAQRVELQLSETPDSPDESRRWSLLRAGADPSESFRIRDYVPGDSLRQIHWKLSEKLDRTLVREPGLPVREQLGLLFESAALPDAAVSPEDADRALELLAGLCRTLCREELLFSIFWQSEGRLCRARIAVPEDADRALRALLRARLCPGDPICRVYSRECGAGSLSHAAVLAPYAAPELELLGAGVRTTLLIPASRAAGLGAWVSGAAVLPYTNETVELEL